MINDQIVSHLERHCLLTDQQYGFRKDRPCLSNILRSLDKMTGLVDDGNTVDVLFLNFVKAFDKVSQKDYTEVKKLSGTWYQWKGFGLKRVVLKPAFSCRQGAAKCQLSLHVLFKGKLTIIP